MGAQGTGDYRRAGSAFAVRIAALAIMSACFIGVAGAQTAPATPDAAIVPLPDPFKRPLMQNPEDPLAMPATPGAPRLSEPVIGGSLADLPEPVRAMREKIIEAAKDADFEALKPLIGDGADATQFSLTPVEGDPLDYLRSLGGDEDGYEILAILEEVLEAGYAVFDPGTENEVYVWPYFTATSLDTLTPKQRVELFKLVTSGDYEDMKSFGAYIFFRAGITPDGKWQFFVAGD